MGSWLRDHPRFLERLYLATRWIFMRLDPLIRRFGYRRAAGWISPPEEFLKKLVFDCRMCGQCILHSTGMTCSMTCPKNLRNGPCGGVRLNGHCEVYPERPCIWVQAYEHSLRMPIYGSELIQIQPPVNRQLEGTSAWINMLTGEDLKVSDGWTQNT
jgi:hypothetical protein